MQNERSLSGVWPSRTMSVNFGLTDAVKARWQKMLCLSDYAPHYLTCLRDVLDQCASFAGNIEIATSRAAAYSRPTCSAAAASSSSCPNQRSL